MFRRNSALTFSSPYRIARSTALSLVVLMVVLVACRPTSDRSSTVGPEIDPAVAVLLVKAEQALAHQDFRRALALADSAVERAPSLADSHFLRGNILTELRRFQQADSSYRKVLSISPNYKGAWFNLGNTAFRLGRLTQALVYYRAEYSEYPSATILVNMGRAYADLGRPDSALHVLLRSVELDARNARAHIRLGQVYEDIGQMENALASSSQALALDPTNLNYKYIVGSQLFRLGKTEQAMEHFVPVTEGMPWHYGAHYYLGQALARLGRRDNAERLLTRADTLQQLESELEQAVAVAEMHPKQPEMWANVAHILRRSARFAEAVQHYELALSLDPHNPNLHKAVADVNLQGGRAKEALARYREVLRLDGTNNDAWIGLGVAYARTGQREEARRAWQHVLSRHPDHELARRYLATLP